MEKQKIKIENNIIELTKKEFILILYLRKVKYGNVTISVRDGIPYKLIESLRLNDLEGEGLDF